MKLDAATKHRIYENLVTHIYEIELNEGDCFIDIGANVGHHTWRMAEQVGASGTGYAIEAVPKLAEQVQRLLGNKKIEWVEVIQGALSDQKGKVEFYFRPKHIGWSSLYEEHVHPEDEEDDLELINLELCQLDDLVLEKLKSVAVMKLDIEHSEFRAMRGGRKTIETMRPVIVFEYSIAKASKVSGYSLEDFFAFFEEMDYSLYDIFCKPFSQKIMSEMRPGNVPVYFLALPSEHKASKDPEGYFQIANAIKESMSL